jgi:hypothetical protein
LHSYSQPSEPEHNDLFDALIWSLDKIREPSCPASCSEDVDDEVSVHSLDHNNDSDNFQEQSLSGYSRSDLEDLDDKALDPNDLYDSRESYFEDTQDSPRDLEEPEDEASDLNDLYDSQESYFGDTQDSPSDLEEPEDEASDYSDQEEY